MFFSFSQARPVITGFSRKLALSALVICAILPLSNSYALDMNGFVEGAYGARLEEDITDKDHYNMSEARFQLKGTFYPEMMEDWEPGISFKGDFFYDGYEDEGKGELRELSISATPMEWLDIKAGRQVLTWGTGDLLFINDLFPKDYVSFFIGRDDEYLKLPSDAFKASIFMDFANVDLVAMPFRANNFITGERLSYFHGMANGGSIVGDNVENNYEEPDSHNIETAIRLYKNINGLEAALYYFNGYYKDPSGFINFTSDTYNFYHPELAVSGFSLRNAMLGGIANMEAGHYNSKEDPHGDDGMIENSSVKFLAGYEKDLGGDLKIGLQFQVEHMNDYSEFLASKGSKKIDEDRHLWALRLTKMAINQNLTMGFFAFYSPSDKDYHMRPRISYKFSDNVSATVGANIFGGEEEYTFFGQLERNNNTYMRLRYSF